MLAPPVAVAEALVAEALLALLEDVVLAAAALEEVVLEAWALTDEALALVADVALEVAELEAEFEAELEAEEEADLSETVPPETEVESLLLMAAEPEAAL